jgi:hypothetical protein
MDAFFLTKALEAPPSQEKFTVSTQKSLMNTIQFILSLTISCYAAYLSWNCSAGDLPVFRIMWSIIAFMFGVLYILFFVLFKAKSCKIM